MLIRRFFGLVAISTGLTTAVELSGYEYIVVGSGAGGGPLATRLALAGHKTLLIEAGNDQGQNHNYSIPSYSARASEDEKLAWNFFVRHYADEERQARDYKTTYTTSDGDEYTGLDPPENSTMKGTLYPRTGTLGGCTAHNALVTIYPHQSDFEYLVALTGDRSWSPENMRKYFTRLENNHYLLFPGSRGHGTKGWLHTSTTPLGLVLQEPQLLSVILGGAFALGNRTNTVFNLATLLAADANDGSVARDTQPGYYQVPIATQDGRRSGPRDFIIAVRDAKNRDGTKKYPLDVRTDCFVTKVIFDKSVQPPRATGVEFLDGKYLYRASPLANPRTASPGTPGRATASREVIVSGGVYNSPQLLKLSGIGPAEELRKFGIKVISDLPGVGTNLQDHYEVAVQGHVPKNWGIADGCTWEDDENQDRCLGQWSNPTLLGGRGLYAAPGAASTMFYKSSVTTDNSYDAFVFGLPANFRGYFPQYSQYLTDRHDWFTWAVLKGHPRNTAGSVTLRSADPLDMPDIVFNYFDTGSGDYNADLQAIYEAVQLGREAFASQPVKVNEVLPGPHVQTKEAIQQYAKDTAWGHHASCTCPIGADGDLMAVLDSKFRVRGVRGLRVVDASVYPRIPGTFTALSTYLVAEKAADDILSEL
ncbi:hypothetical protein EYZ11_013449 [Aspergillus tanneri]|uniref:Glucose-methanol-choline oxidoreductase N-terminal domain-containing protein n=1 Tax=Aspergillus tanneri TaxID=1220188 RepID=A0A4S3IXW4_9EURO|nr:uncharacterized protein ATNIH1004_005506 [Aspergillus tanneri]KAA8646831.1 hypothetical protein ATNIH1004_005506 [Aspergillus tanneri]THC87105.1 hypothetical protein EYZ11_013449 [Aspergillus tanneri]